MEYHYVFKKAKIGYEQGLREMIAAGLDSMPGGGAEIFHPEIRDQIAGGKCSGDEWLEMHETFHKLGKRFNATMLYGHMSKCRTGGCSHASTPRIAGPHRRIPKPPFR